MIIPHIQKLAIRLESVVTPHLLTLGGAGRTSPCRRGPGGGVSPLVGT